MIFSIKTDKKRGTSRFHLDNSVKCPFSSGMSQHAMLPRRHGSCRRRFEDVGPAIVTWCGPSGPSQVKNICINWILRIKKGEVHGLNTLGFWEVVHNPITDEHTKK